MANSARQRQRNLEYVLATRDAPTKVERSKRVIRVVGIVVGGILVLAPALYFHDLGLSRYVIAFLAAIGGILVFWGEVNRSATEQIEDLHEFIDFDRIKADIDRADV